MELKSGRRKRANKNKTKEKKGRFGEKEKERERENKRIKADGIASGFVLGLKELKCSESTGSPRFSTGEMWEDGVFIIPFCCLPPVSAFSLSLSLRNIYTLRLWMAFATAQMPRTTDRNYPINYVTIHYWTLVRVMSDFCINRINYWENTFYSLSNFFIINDKIVTYILKFYICCYRLCFDEKKEN